MGYVQNMQECRRYIDDNINQQLTPMGLAKRYNYSFYHFCRIFRISNGTSVAAYIRKRKLLLAAEKIQQGQGIYEAALDVGFDTPSGFSKAFRKAFGCSPTQYLHRQPQVSPEKGEIKVNAPKILKGHAIKAVGHTCEVDKKEVETMPEGAYWYYADLPEGKHHGHMGKELVRIGMWMKEADPQGNLSYFFGTRVDEFSDMDAGLTRVEIPESTYAVFTTEPLNIQEGKDHGAFVARIQDTWKYIFEKWLDESEYALDDDGCDFEYYDYRCANREAACMDIYIPVKKK